MIVNRPLVGSVVVGRCREHLRDLVADVVGVLVGVNPAAVESAGVVRRETRDIDTGSRVVGCGIHRRSSVQVFRPIESRGRFGLCCWLCPMGHNESKGGAFKVSTQPRPTGRRMTGEECQIIGGDFPSATNATTANTPRLHQLAKPLFGYVGSGGSGD